MGRRREGGGDMKHIEEMQDEWPRGAGCSPTAQHMNGKGGVETNKTEKTQIFVGNTSYTHEIQVIGRGSGTNKVLHSGARTARGARRAIKDRPSSFSASDMDACTAVQLNVLA